MTWAVRSASFQKYFQFFFSRRAGAPLAFHFSNNVLKLSKTLFSDITIYSRLTPSLLLACTVAFWDIETMVFDPASVFLSTHWWSQKPASQFLPKETCSFYKRDLFRRFSAHPASGFLKHIVRNWPNPGCSFYVPVSMSRNHPVINVVALKRFDLSNTTVIRSGWQWQWISHPMYPHALIPSIYWILDLFKLPPDKISS